MDTYSQHMKARGLEEYTVDGALNHDAWNSTPLKILFLLKENYGYQGVGIFQTSDEAAGWLKARIKTYIKIVQLAALLHDAYADGRSLSVERRRVILEDDRLMRETLNLISVVNIKKHSGASKSNDREIRYESKKNADLLREQISFLRPKIIITGGTVCWHSLTNDIRISKAVPPCPKNGSVCSEGMILCHANHPSAWAGGGFDIDLLHRSILSCLKSEPDGAGNRNRAKR